ncbi:MAG: hypothetical protein DRG33_03220 [Deltaproteobacteria bacterium]|nr:MAG: hypothetical protein DRG33_03220 [Deltaproteobacteria bacterium]
MFDSMGQYTIESEGCTLSRDGISAINNGTISLELVDPALTGEHVLGYNNSYIAIAYSGSFPEISQHTLNGESIDHEMISLSILNGYVNAKINPSANGDLSVLELETFTPFDDVTRDSRVIITTKIKEQKNRATGDVENWMQLYFIVAGNAFLIGESFVGNIVAGTARSRVTIMISDSTIISAISFGKKDFSVRNHIDTRQYRDKEEVETQIGIATVIQYARNTTRGFANKITKMFKI